MAKDSLNYQERLAEFNRFNRADVENIKSLKAQLAINNNKLDSIQIQLQNLLAENTAQASELLLLRSDLETGLASKVDKI